MSESVFQDFAKGLGNPNADPMVWGGKGAGLAKMAGQGYPVPPGFTISTELCKAYNDPAIGPELVMDAIMLDIDEHLHFIKDQIGYMPLLSVRSGAPISMPGMMDTILNVGMNENEMVNWIDRIGERAAWDSYRRLLQMMGSTGLGIDHSKFENELTKARTKAAVETDAELKAYDLMELAGWYKAIYAESDKKVPVTLKDQLRVCIDAVFRSWMAPNAIEYRKIENIDESLGTAVTVQAMVFGNMNDNSGSGVLFTRNPSTGENKIFAEYLTNAQGEDVVAGIRTPEVLELDAPVTEIWKIRLRELCGLLESDYTDMVDAEFTVQDGELFMLQSRVGKRSAQAAFKIALDLMDEKVIDENTVFKRLKRKHLLAVRRPSIDPKFKKAPDWTGIAASMGIASGRAVTTSQAAVEAAALGEKVILVTEETTPDDIAGMNAAVGILTRTGGATSHAAVVARGMDKPCVVGCTSLKMDKIPQGSVISIDGETGRVWLGQVPVVSAANSPDVARFVDMAMARTGRISMTDRPAKNACVAVSSWIGLSVAEINARLDESKKIVAEGHTMILDVTPPHKIKSNDGWDIAGLVPEEIDFQERVIKSVLMSGLKDVYYVGETDVPEMLEAAGIRHLPEVGILMDLIEAQGFVALTPELMNALGCEGVMFLQKKGMMNSRVFDKPYPPMYTAFEMLGN